MCHAPWFPHLVPRIVLAQSWRNTAALCRLPPCFSLVTSCYVLLLRPLRSPVTFSCYILLSMFSFLCSPCYILPFSTPPLPPSPSSPVYTFSRKYNNNRWHYSPLIGSDLRPPLFDCGGRKRNTPRGRRAEHQTTVPVPHSVQKHPGGGGLSGTASRHGPSPLSYIL